MAQLTESQRRQIWRGLMRYWSKQGKQLGAMVKEDIYDAVVATDVFIEDNQGAFNQAIPQPFRAEADLDDKTLMFCAVAAMRVSAEFCRQLFGDLD
jgi:hypothetical protein